MQAAVLRVKAPHLPAWTEARRRNARRYAKLFQDAGLRVADGIVAADRTPVARRHIYNQFVIRTGDRDEPQAASRRSKASATRSTIPSRSTCSRASRISATAPAHFPEAERAAADSLAIPIYGELTLEQQQAVVDAVAEFVGASIRA